MASLLDWLTDGTLTSGLTNAAADISGTSANSAVPTPQPTPPLLPPTPTPAAVTPTPDPMPAAGPSDPPVPLPTPRPAGAPNATFAPDQTNTNPISTPAPGFNASPLAAGGGKLTPDDARAVVKSYQAAGGHAFDGYEPTAGSPTSLAPPGNGTNGVGPGLGVGAPPMPVPGTPSPLPGVPASAPYKFGDQTALGRALGIDPKSQAFRTAMAGLGAGLTAAGNSKGKSAGQAFASGAGASLEGSAKEAHSLDKDAQGYLAQAIAAKKAGNERDFNIAWLNYQISKQKAEQQQAASKDAATSKNDSPTQLYLAAQRNVAADPLVKGAMSAYQAALKTGTPQEIASAKSAYEQTVQERQAAHLAGVGLHPQSAAEIAKQPGMSQANPVDAGKLGITAANIGKKLQPGQYYRNPADGKVYQFKGSLSKSSALSAVSAE